MTRMGVYARDELLGAVSRIRPELASVPPCRRCGRIPDRGYVRYDLEVECLPSDRPAVCADADLTPEELAAVMGDLHRRALQMDAVYSGG